MMNFAASIGKEAKFPLGKTVATPGALAAMQRTGEPPTKFLARHQSGDWGSVGRSDWQANDADLKDEGRLLSAYKLADETKIWVITEADRSSTCILLADEY